jgi:Na+/H+ antiporter 1
MRNDGPIAVGRSSIYNFMTNEEQQAALHALEEACEKVQPPLHRMEHALHPWVTFFIMPVFAFANAGVVLHGNFADTFTEPVALGVILGLLLGKPLGITLASCLAVRSHPRGRLARWHRLYDVPLCRRTRLCGRVASDNGKAGHIHGVIGSGHRWLRSIAANATTA